MRKLTQEELNEIARKHKLWLKSGEEGERADLSNCDLDGADLRGFDLRFVVLDGASLRNADLREANLYGASLSGADLTDADLRLADLLKSNLEKTNIIRFDGPRYEAYYFIWSKEVVIGCQQHSLEYWLENYENIGYYYGYGEEEIEQYGAWLKSLDF